MIATVNLPAVDLNATNLTVRLGDSTLPTIADLPATLALMNHLAMVLGPIEPESGN